MAGINKVILIGHLGNDPELRTTASGDAVTTLSLATSESWIDKITNEKKEVTEWHRCVLFRRQAEIAGQYLRKGSKVYLEGKLKTRSWQDNQQPNKTNYITEIHVVQLQMLDKLSTVQQQQKNEAMSQAENVVLPDYPTIIDDSTLPF